ncbi:MAG: HD domain-containing protein [Candidatus Omnitrophica bacterium]|nr:HD domain-containing protein [Candidatus Omnitrophota bacterium]
MLLPKDRRILKEILSLSKEKGITLYLVGGYLRDLLLFQERVSPDIDFALKKGAIKFAHQLCRILKAGFVVLDKTRGCSRIVKKRKSDNLTLDFTDFRGRDLIEDLGRRDFTINAIATELEAFLKTPDLKKKSILIDPYSGLADLESKTIRLIRKGAFDDDPLRILRAFSLGALLGFALIPETKNFAFKKRAKLKRVSPERIREELFKVLSAPSSVDCLMELERYKILEIIIPEIRQMFRLKQGPYHHLDVWAHTLETVRKLELLTSYLKANRDVYNYLNEEISSGHSRLQLMKFAALLHDVGKPKTLRIEQGRVRFHGHERVGARMTKEICERLRISNEETKVLYKIVLFHLRPGYLISNPLITRRAKFRFFRDTGREAISILLLSLADLRATKGPLRTPQSLQRHKGLVYRLASEYFKRLKEKKPKRLLTGDDLISHFKLEPSPLIGRILSEIEEAQAIGKIRTKREALKLAGEILNGR